VLRGRDLVELRDALGGRDREGLEMHLEAEIELLRDTLGGHDRASLEMHVEAKIKLSSEMHLEALIKGVWRYTWRPRSIEIGGST